MVTGWAGRAEKVSTGAPPASLRQGPPPRVLRQPGPHPPLPLSLGCGG